jgi:DNA-binding HxlR family transcriptional regulator
VLGRDYPAQNCSVARALEVVGERWTLLIVRDAFLGVSRFDDFARRLGVAENVLSRRLATLVEAGVLERRAYAPRRHDYLLTTRGRDLFPVIVSLLAWGDAHAAPDGAPVRVRHAGCGGGLGAGARCARCGADVGADDAEWLWGPGSGRRPSVFHPRPPGAPRLAAHEGRPA